MAVASTIATIISVPLAVKDFTGGDFDDFAVGLGTNSLWDTSGVAVACKSSRQESRNDGDETGKLHLDVEIEGDSETRVGVGNQVIKKKRRRSSKAMRVKLQKAAGEN